MEEHRTVLCRQLLEKTNESVKILNMNPSKGLSGLAECVGLIMEIYDTFEEDAV